MVANLVANSVVVLLLLNLVLVCSQLGPFINPPERPNGALPDGSTNPVYAVGNPLNITWTPATGIPTLTIWQTWSNGSDIGGLQYLPGPTTTDKRLFGTEAAADVIMKQLDEESAKYQEGDQAPG